MAEAYKINFYPKPVPPAKPKVKSFEEIQRLLAQAPQTPEYNGPQKTAIQCTNRGAHQFR